MPAKRRLTMRQLRQMLRLAGSGTSSREIAVVLGVARSTVQDNLKRAAQVGLTWPLPGELTDDALEHRLFARAGVKQGQRRRKEPDWAELSIELKKPGVTLLILWEEYRSVHPDGYGYSRFCELFRGFEKRLSPTMRQEHAAGDKVFVDYSGKKVGIVDPATGIVREAVEETLAQLDSGALRVAEKRGTDWHVNQWAKKAVLLSFRLNDNQIMRAGDRGPTSHAPGVGPFWDKVPNKFGDWGAADYQAAGFRSVPGAIVRRGAYVGKNVVLMPSYVNIGAYVDEGSMVDAWATVGSCAQIGKNVHLSGGVGIGGVLEPLQAGPTIIEDNCFIGARSEVVEGVIVEENSVISMGVYISQSTKIYDRATGEVTYGRIPAGSVVVSGNLPSADGKYSLYCAVIVKRVDAQTRAKTGVNELLRD